MTTRAIFVVSSAGKWRDDSGATKDISIPLDLEHIKSSRAWADVIVSSGETVRTNQYRPTKKPLKIITRSSDLEFRNLIAAGNASIMQKSASEALAILTCHYKNILIEFGPTLLNEALSAGLIDEFDLSIVGDFQIEHLRELLALLPFKLSFSDFEILQQAPGFTLLRFYL